MANACMCAFAPSASCSLLVMLTVYSDLNDALRDLDRSCDEFVHKHIESYRDSTQASKSSQHSKLRSLIEDRLANAMTLADLRALRIWRGDDRDAHRIRLRDVPRREWSDTRGQYVEASRRGVDDVVVALSRTSPRKAAAIAKTQLRTRTSLTFNGRAWRQVEKMEDELWGFEYVTARDYRVRDEHRALNAVRYPVDDPFWNKYAPPNGWNCRCGINPILVAQRWKTIIRPAPHWALNKISVDFRWNPGEVYKLF